MTNGNPLAPRTPEEFEQLPDVADTVQKLKDAGYLVVAVLNQPHIGNDRVSRTLVDQMHAQLNALLPVDNM